MRVAPEVLGQVRAEPDPHKHVSSADGQGTIVVVSHFTVLFVLVIELALACPDGTSRGVKRSATSTSTRSSKRGRTRGAGSRGRGRRKASSFADD